MFGGCHGVVWCGVQRGEGAVFEPQDPVGDVVEAVVVGDDNDGAVVVVVGERAQQAGDFESGPPKGKPSSPCEERGRRSDHGSPCIRLPASIWAPALQT